ncbi:hypothetical protein GGTG_01397 [Gaeumannomyces tritici R3-111a-1]|uniref:Uncharacterized protein n=1 Tax=Gaeumannomyces tritici (strain R3-111a-1) TaxID=644352 RepID=J3NJG5_GAET3|nr:hypothetical protein GGTG_01397 [Gaeumannomyces tritici R3-111a-1]EJT81417.1 hypothetical protein GGTG_01397 [Gaeumannomyces tritici R3-111a-1]
MHIDDKHANRIRAIWNGGYYETSSAWDIHTLLLSFPSNKGGLGEKRRPGWHEVPVGTERKEAAEAFVREVLRKQRPDEVVIKPLPARPSRFQKLFPDRGRDAVSEESDDTEPAQEAAEPDNMKYHAYPVVTSNSWAGGVQNPATCAQPDGWWRAQDGAGGPALQSQPVPENRHLDIATTVADTPNTSTRRRVAPNISLWSDDEDDMVEDSSSREPAPTALTGTGIGLGSLPGKKHERWMVRDWRRPAPPT